MNKFIKSESLPELSLRLKSENKKIVLANGAFDMLHVGHLRYLTDAKKYGNVLIVAINSDASVKLSKGENRPVIGENERVEIISALEVVDYVTLFDEKDVSRVIKLLKPDFHAKGTDYSADSVPEKKIVEKYGGKVIITGDHKDHSTTDIISKLKEIFCE